MGAVANLNYMQMVDCALGFVGIDIGGDDGRLLGLWPWEPEEGHTATREAQEIHDEFFGEMSR